MKALLLFCLTLTACTVRPTVRNAAGDMATLGGSIFTKSSSETAYYKGPLGEMGYADFGKDETVIPAKYLNFKGIEATLNAATSSMRTKESTTRVLAKEETKKVGIQSAERVETLKILNPVEEAAPSVFDPATGLNTVP